MKRAFNPYPAIREAGTGRRRLAERVAKSSYTYMSRQHNRPRRTMTTDESLILRLYNSRPFLSILNSAGLVAFALHIFTNDMPGGDSIGAWRSLSCFFLVIRLLLLSLFDTQKNLLA